MASVISGDANVSATEFGFLDGVTSALQTQMDAKLPIAGGKILQVVRATDSTTRTTTSTTYTDVTGMSVTITPTKSTSAIIVVAVAFFDTLNTGNNYSYGLVQLTDSSNNPLSGAENHYFGLNNVTRSGNIRAYIPTTIIAYSTPATTSATTYKMRFKVDAGTLNEMRVSNADSTGQMYAIEVSA